MEYRALRTKGLKVINKLQPILQNLIFVKSTYPQLKEIYSSHNYLYFTYTKTGGDNKNRPIIVGNEEMEQFINFIDGHFGEIVYIEPTSFNLAKGERVRIIDGPFSGKEGLFVSVSGKKFKQIVVSIDGVIAVHINTPRPWTIIERLTE